MLLEWYALIGLNAYEVSLNTLTRLIASFKRSSPISRTGYLTTQRRNESKVSIQRAETDAALWVDPQTKRA